MSDNSTATPALQAAWQLYHSTLEEMRLLIEATPRFKDTPQHRAKAYHALMEMQAMAYNFVVAPRMQHPRILFNSGWQTHMYTLGQNGQDFLYGVLFVDGSQTYRLSGRMGDISLFLLQTHNGVFGEPDVDITGNYDWADFEIDEDGCFEVTISATEAPGNWIKTDPDSGYQFMLIRRALADWDGDPGELGLERISDIADDHYDSDEFDEAAIAARIHRAAHFVRYLVNCFTIGLYDMYLHNAGSKNSLSLLPGTTTSQVGSPTSSYAMAVFELAADEALIIEMDKTPDGVYWSLQAGDVWSRSLEFGSRHSSLNNHEVVAQADGSIVIVVSQQDPGIANWLDTCGRLEGTIVFRNYRAMSQPVPSSRKVAFADLKKLLPADVARVTPRQRRDRIEQRRLAQLKLYGE
jgi:hypothetical protein